MAYVAGNTADRRPWTSDGLDVGRVAISAHSPCAVGTRECTQALARRRSMSRPRGALLAHASLGDVGPWRSRANVVPMKARWQLIIARTVHQSLTYKIGWLRPSYVHHANAQQQQPVHSVNNNVDRLIILDKH